MLDKMGLKVIPGGCQISNRRIPAGDKRLDGGGSIGKISVWHPWSSSFGSIVRPIGDYKV